MLQRPLILLLTLYIVFIGGTAYTTNIPFFTVGYHIIAGLTLVGWLVVKLRNQHPWPRTPLDLPLLLYVVLLMIATLAARDIRVSVQQSWQMIVHVIMFYVLVDLMRRGKQRWVFEGIFIAAGVAMMISLLEVASWYVGLGFAGYEFGWAGQPTTLPPTTYKVQLALNVSTIVGNYAMTILPVMVGWGLSTPRRDYKIGLFGLAFGVLLMLVGTQSRGAWGAMLAAGGVLAVFALMRWQPTARLFTERVGFAAIAAGVLATTAVLMGYATISTSTSDMRREDMWVSAISIAQDDPLTGAGVGLFGLAYRPLRDTAFIQDRIVAAHNLVLNTLSEIGIGGVLLLAWMAVVLLRVWYAGWRGADTAQQFRYEGILAALCGFFVHSGIDMFASPSIVLTLLAIVAYVMARHEMSTQPSLTAVYTNMHVIALLFVLSSVGWLLSTDVALLRSVEAWRELGDENYAAALERFEDAEAADPALGVYELQQAYVLGLLADEDPDTYLQQAIKMHEQILEDQTTYDMGYANLAALYVQQGNPTAALPLVERALEIHPDIWEYYFLRGRIYEALGNGDAALADYTRAIEEEPSIAGSPYWQFESETLNRTEALRQAIADMSPNDAMQTALAAGLAELATAQAADLEQVSIKDGVDWLALGFFYTHTGDMTMAIDALTAAIDLLAVSDEQLGILATAYAARASLYLQLNDLNAAERDVEAALFLDASEGASAYYVLVQIIFADERDVTDEIINRYLVRAVPPRVVLQEYAGTVYRTVAQLDYLPQLGVPGPGLATYAPWLLLAERYTNDDDDETNPQDVYSAIQDRSPYVDLSDVR